MNQTNFPTEFFESALGDNPAATPLRIESALRQHTEGRAVVASGDLELEVYARLGLCQLAPATTPRPDHYFDWGGEDCDRLVDRYTQVCWRVGWQDQHFEVVQCEWASACGGESRYWVLAESAEVAKAFILDVERKTHAPGEAILVFSDGFWHRSHSLYQATQSASFEDLVLADGLKQTIQDDFQRFLVSKEEYDRLGIAWRRGALFIGPPGNGKTHCVRALVKSLGIPSLYVQSLAHQYYTPEQMWQQVFNRARGLRPCVLVLEDLDSLVDDDNRSFFLNQLDGFERNHGLIVLATTNYPERIDSAIIDRPSRFDRKYHFQLPSQTDRYAYLQHWQQQLATETGWKAEQVEPIASLCEGFSFAYMKELVISTVMQWIADRSVPFAKVAQSQTRLLKKQMSGGDKQASRGRLSFFRARNNVSYDSTED